MHYQHLKNFIETKVRKNDKFVPATILFLIRNNGKGDVKQIAKLLYIFDYKHSLEHYETVVEKFSTKLLESYHIIHKKEQTYILNTWPLSEDEIDDISLRCSKISNGFFSNLSSKVTQS